MKNRNVSVYCIQNCLIPNSNPKIRLRLSSRFMPALAQCGDVNFDFGWSTFFMASPFAIAVRTSVGRSGTSQ